MKLNKQNVIYFAKMFGIGALSAIPVIIGIQHGYNEGYDKGTRFGATAVRDAGREMYDDFDEKLEEYVSRDEEEE